MGKIKNESICEMYAREEVEDLFKDAIKIADEAMEKLKRCRGLLADGLLPMSVSDTGQNELMLLNCVILAASRVENCIVVRTKRHKKFKKYQLKIQ